MNHGIMMQNCMQVSSKMARQGDYRGAQSYQFMQKQQIKQNIVNTQQLADYDNYKCSMAPQYEMMGA